MTKFCHRGFSAGCAQAVSGCFAEKPLPPFPAYLKGGKWGSSGGGRRVPLRELRGLCKKSCSPQNPPTRRGGGFWGEFRRNRAIGF
jgi:hypothetical protein